jgi:putative pyruvate formate lyase activating enzyme
LSKKFRPVYHETARKGILRERVDQARSRLASCTLCPRKCGVDRLAGKTGICRTGRKALVSSFDSHFGEEAPLVGRKGSGTIFFTWCNLGCVFCQNDDISRLGYGEEVSDSALAGIMIRLQRAGCHNINFVTPSHVVPQILSAVEKGVEMGLDVPLIYNSSGYDSVDALRLLDGIIDIYMPDFKFWEADVAEMTCSAGDYPETARNAILEMYRQVGDFKIDSGGIARSGLLVRHLVLPGGLSGTREIVRFIAERVSPETYVNIMSQYRPCGRASEIPALSVALSDAEYKSAVAEAREAGLTRIDPL